MKAEQLVFRLSQGREDNGVQSPLCFGRLRRSPAGEEVEMNFLEERIVREGAVKEGNVLKVDSFLNHQLDIDLLDEIGREFKRYFGKKKINKILTIEASGIAIACMAAYHFDVPVVFAKKSQSVNIDGEVFLQSGSELPPK